MRQNGATSAPFFYCVSYEILRETRIKPSFFGNCLIFLSSALGAQCLGSQFAGVAPQAIRAKGRRLNAASVREASARARRRRVKFFAQLSTKESWQGRWCPVGTVQRLTEAAAEKGQRPTVL